MESALLSCVSQEYTSAKGFVHKLLSYSDGKGLPKSDATTKKLEKKNVCSNAFALNLKKIHCAQLF